MQEFFKQEYERQVLQQTQYLSRSGGHTNDDDNSGDDSSDFTGTSSREPNDTYLIGGSQRKGDINYDLLVRLVIQLVNGSNSEQHSNNNSMFAPATGCILVFVPGVPEITKALNLIQTHLAIPTSTNNGRSSKRVKLFALHGGVSAADQQKVFRLANKDELKVVVSTNVAEASVTIPDVTVVVDTCKVKEMHYDLEHQSFQLVTKFSARNNLLQRKGRAGRVQAGRYFALITRVTFDKQPQYAVPEILRSPIESLVLQCTSILDSMHQVNCKKAGGAVVSDAFHDCFDLLRYCVDPPSFESVQAALDTLVNLQAVERASNSTNELLSDTPAVAVRMTALGKQLAKLPCTPEIGRLLVFGALLGCMFHSSCVAAYLALSKSVFLNGFNNSDISKKIAAAKVR